MRIISWNCNGAFARKLPLVSALAPDILVIQEASERDIAAVDAPFTHWVGKGHRGLAIIGYTDLEYRVDPAWQPELPWFTPIHAGDLHLLAVWASVLIPTRRYVRLVHEAVNLYCDFLDCPRGIIAGDLNSNTCFDRKHRSLTHTSLVERLAALTYESAWHHHRREEHGQESLPTFYLYRRHERAWMLDYVFLTQTLLHTSSITIGEPEAWLAHSDHLPLIIDF